MGLKGSHLLGVPENPTALWVLDLVHLTTCRVRVNATRE